jgi:hypothetical protein
MNKDTEKSTFKQLFSALSQIKQRLEEMEADRHWKKMNTQQFIELMITSQLNKEPSLRDISNSLNNEDLGKDLGLDSISASTVSRRQRELATEVLEMLFKSLIAEFAKKHGFDSIKRVSATSCERFHDHQPLPDEIPLGGVQENQERRQSAPASPVLR